MDAATARADLALLVAADVDPVLTSEELDRLVELARRVDVLGASPDVYEPWRPITPYLAGQQTVPEPRDGRLYQAVQSGSSGAVQPVWPTTTTVNEAVSAPSAPTLTVGGTPGGTVYAYRVSPVGTGGEGAASDETYTTYGAATLTVGNNIAVTWTAVPSATGYHVYGRTLHATFRLTSSPTTSLTYTDTGAATPAGLLPGAFLDGTVGWLDVGPASWTPTFDLDAAAAAAWRLKAAKAATRIDFTADGASFKRSQIVNGCLQMAKVFAAKTAGQFELPVPAAPRRYFGNEALDDRLDSEEFPLRSAWTNAIGLTPEQVP